jgi:hypothetical protein
MNECKIRGCRSLETKCTDCGRTVITATFEYPKWNNVEEKPLPVDGIPFLGLVLINKISVKLIFFANDANAHRIKYWLPLPELPEQLNGNKCITEKDI